MVHSTEEPGDDRLCLNHHGAMEGKHLNLMQMVLVGLLSFYIIIFIKQIKEMPWFMYRKAQAGPGQVAQGVPVRSPGAACPAAGWGLGLA